MMHKTEKRLSPGNRRPLRVVIAGGGTGGHVFPGIALAEAFQVMNSGSRILFAGTGNRLETEAFRETPFGHRAISAGGLKGKSIRRRMSALGKVCMGVYQSIRLIQSFKPDLVIGVGGYVSGPMVLAAFLCRVPRAIHEQNRAAGLANRWLAPLADRIYVTFPDTRGLGVRKNVRITGNPVRKRVSGASGVEEGRETAKPFTVLVFGGSQGARRINDAVVDALGRLPLETVRFIHQTGEENLAAVRSAYAARGAAGRIEPFFSDMGRWYAEADLVICRAGATTIAEVTALGKACIYIPYPFAADDHQRLNAQSLVSGEAGEMILEQDLTGEVLAGRIQYYAAHPEALERMACRAKTFGRPEAAETIVSDCYELLGE